MDGASRNPPRFVPTLTTVVDMHAQVEAPAPTRTPAPASTPAPMPAPPPAVAQRPASAPETRPPAPEPLRARSPIDEAGAFRLEEELLHRVLQRVDLSLEERLTEVVSATVQQQLDAMVPRLRQEVESALRRLVVEALAHELSETPGSGARTPTRLGLN